MKSILDKIFTSNATIFDVVWKFIKMKPKNFRAHFRRFFVYALLRPMSHTSIFLQIEGVRKIHNRGKFHEYSICGCQVINFQSFSCWFSIHEMALFGGFLGPNFFKCCPILMKFSPGVVFKKKTLYFKNLWKIQIFTRTVDNQNSDFWFNFDFPFPLKMAEIKKIALTQNVSHRAILISQNQGPISSCLPRKKTITFCSILAIFSGNRTKPKVKMSESKFEKAILPTRFLGIIQLKKVSFHYFPVLWL